MNFNKYFGLVIAIFGLKLICLGIYPFHHPSEVRYASIAMRMALTNNYLMPYFNPEIPFFGKPPLAFLASAIFIKIFGYHEFTARLPHFITLIIICWFIFDCLKKIYDRKTAIATLLILSSFTLFYALHSVMTEAFLCLGMTIMTFSFFLQIQNPFANTHKNIYGYLFFLGAAIAMLTKGPVGIIMPVFSICIYLLISKRTKEAFIKMPIIYGITLFLSLSLPWFILAELKYPGFLEYFIIGENWDRFTQPGWQGDRYGFAHKVPIGTIWYFFVVSTLPAILIIFLKPKRIFLTTKEIIFNNTKKDEAFKYFLITTLAPLMVLTFMKNMIIPYSIYSLVSFSVIIARICIINNYQRFLSFVGYFTIIAYLVAIFLMLSNNSSIKQKINYQAYLIDHIDKSYINQADSKLYYLEEQKKLFTGYWYFKDRAKTLTKQDLMNMLDSHDNAKLFIISTVKEYTNLPKEYQTRLVPIACSNAKTSSCLYTHSK